MYVLNNVRDLVCQALDPHLACQEIHHDYVPKRLSPGHVPRPDKYVWHPRLIVVVLKCKDSLPPLERVIIACKVLLIVTLPTLEVLGMLDTFMHMAGYSNEMEN